MELDWQLEASLLGFSGGYVSVIVLLVTSSSNARDAQKVREGLAVG